MNNFFIKTVSLAKRLLLQVFLFLVTLAAFQCAHFQEMYLRFDALESSLGALAERQTVSELDAGNKLQKSEKEMESCSWGIFSKYLRSWKSLAEPSFWSSPQKFYSSKKPELFSQTVANFYPAIALTPLSFVYTLYAYGSLLSLFSFVRLVSWLFSKKESANSSPESRTI